MAAGGNKRGHSFFRRPLGGFSPRKPDEEEDWQVICEQSLFSNRLHQLEEICLNEYKGKSSEFIQKYLRPVVELLDTIRSKCQEYYEQRRNGQHGKEVWAESYENIVKFVIHPSPLKIVLTRGDFYIHISTSVPKALELKYFYKGVVCTRTLSIPDTVLMCSENWTELLRSEVQEKNIYVSCVLWTSTGFNTACWADTLKGRVAGNMEVLSSKPEENVTHQNEAHPKDSVINMEELSVKPILILDLNFELLSSQVAYLPGSRDSRGGPVIFFETNKMFWENNDMNSEELANLLIYYFKIVRESSRSLGCSLVVDARGSKQSRDILECIGKAVQLFEQQVSGCVYMAHVLTMKGSLMLLLKPSKIQENLNFKFEFHSSVEKLSRDIPLDQLPESYGGHLVYDHEQWIKFRTKIEPFMTGCRSAAKLAMNYIQQLSRTDLGSTVDECEKLLEEHKSLVKVVLDDSRLHGLRSEGISLLERLENEECEAYHKTDDYKHTLECLHRLYNQMTRVFDRLQMISDRRTKHLEVNHKEQMFQASSNQMITWLLEEGIPFLHREKDIGNSLETSKRLLDEFETFTLTADEQLTRSEESLSLGKFLLDTNELLHVSRDEIVTKHEELKELLETFTPQRQNRSKKLKKSYEFYQLLNDGSTWWMSGLEYIAHMNMEDIQTEEGIERLKTSLDEFMKNTPKCQESQIARLTELAHHLGSKPVESAEQVNSKCLEVEAMLQAKNNQIMGARERLKKSRHSSVIYSDGDEHSSGFKDDDLSTEPDGEEYRQFVQAESESNNRPVDDSVLFGWNETDSPYDENDAKLAVFDAAMTTKMKERLQHIIGEMISTESEYVNSLEYILINYMPDMSSETVPAFLKGKKNVLFGNIERIYDFHKRFFSQEVVTYRHAPLQIGKCFLKWERQFYLYALYNKNKPKSDQLWDDYANNFFQYKLKELNDKLDLASYLIKPVQRLGKYALLLRDMISCCDPKDPRVVEMNAAHELMKFQLRHGNDLLAMDSIRNADVNLKEQGCLLRQADFIVYEGKKKRPRRLFLFDHLLVFTKTKKEKARGDVFTYKHSVKMVDLGLTENIGDSGLKFEVWYRRWKKRKVNETYILSAFSECVKKSWTDDISRILWRQASRNKEHGLTEVTTGISVESTPSSLFYDTTHHSYSRMLRNEHPAVNSKRLSWLSGGESSGSSGVHDLGSLPEDNCSGNVSRNPDDFRTTLVRGDVDVKYASLPRKKSHQNAVHVNTPLTLMDISTAPPVRRNVVSPGYDGSFIRNNVYRKTYQVDSSASVTSAATVPIRPPRKKAANRRNAAGRYATQPIILPSEFIIANNNTKNNNLTRSLENRARSPVLNTSLPGSPSSPTLNTLDYKLHHRHVAKSHTDNNICSANNNNINKSRTNSAKSEPCPRMTSPVLRKSFTDQNILVIRNHSKSMNEDANAVQSTKDSFKRRSSFNKAIDHHNISVDEREKWRTHSRSPSSVDGDSAEVFGERSHDVSFVDGQLSPKCSTPTLSRSEKKNPLFQLRAKLSKSLSEF